MLHGTFKNGSTECLKAHAFLSFALLFLFTFSLLVPSEKSTVTNSQG